MIEWQRWIMLRYAFGAPYDGDWRLLLEEYDDRYVVQLSSSACTLYKHKLCTAEICWVRTEAE